VADDNTSNLKQIKVNLKKELGSGGYGIVFQGEWNNIQVAVKQILSSKVESNKREEEALQKLNHPNVIKLFYVESNSENRYLINQERLNLYVNK
jgi:serine/threonine-protein kinase/endoribonuclease IRE1